MDKKHAEIVGHLMDLEQERGGQILYAAESGSRAWGFPSRDSDYDVRVIYVETPSWYNRLEDQKDNYEVKIDEIDIQAWDLRKALRLYRKCNPAIFEWLRSPIKYVVRQPFYDNIMGLQDKYFHKTALCYHYLHMANGNYSKYIQGRPTINMKKLLYVLRPLMCVRWIEQDCGFLPTDFNIILTVVDAPKTVKDFTWELIGAKKAGLESLGNTFPAEIDDYIAKELQRMLTSKYNFGKPLAPWHYLNKLFTNTLEEVWR